MYCEDVFPGWVNLKQNGVFIGSKAERGVIASEWVWKRASTLRVGRVAFSWMSCKNYYSKHWF